VNNGGTTVGLVGIGGYGDVYLRALLAEAPRPVTLVAGVDPQPVRSAGSDELQRRGVPVFESLDAMYAGGVAPELVVLATPLQLHADQACAALARGSHVLCEKPMAATPADAARMIGARDRSGRVLSIGFQWAFAPGVRRLKADVLAGRFGRPTRFRTKVYWPRNEAYYGRNDWAGRLRTPDGRVVLDSPVNNACAHYVHNMLHLLGESDGQADWPASVTAELYRANAIENYDTATFRCATRRGVELMVAVTHASQGSTDPTFELAFERAVITTGGPDGNRIIARPPGGDTVEYGVQPRGDDVEKLWATIDAIRHGTPPACGAESAAAHTALVDGVQRSATPASFPPELVRRDAVAGAVFVPGLEAVMDRCYDGFALPSELGVPWARPGRSVQVGGLAT
jgi:predicted dehydrogenase